MESDIKAIYEVHNVCQEFTSHGYQSSMAKKKSLWFSKEKWKDGGEMEGEDGGETRQDDKTKK